jgi:hypothetical protein
MSRKHHGYLAVPQQGGAEEEQGREEKRTAGCFHRGLRRRLCSCRAIPGTFPQVALNQADAIFDRVNVLSWNWEPSPKTAG